MEKAQTFENNNGGQRMPVGYRFRPTEEELVVDYLKPKALSLPLPAKVIPDFDVSKIDPYAFPVGDVKEKRYFFYKKEMKSNVIDVVGRRRYCSSGSGYWKPVGKGRVILASDWSKSNQPVGLRRTLAFCQRKRLRDTNNDNNNNNNTRWLLHEYHLVRSGPNPNSIHLICPMGMGEYWVVCGLFQKKRRLVKKNVVVTKNKTCVVNHSVEDVTNSSPNSPTMSCSSDVTDNESDYQIQEHNSVV